MSWWRHQIETFPRHWAFVRGIHRWPVNSPHKGQWREALMFSLICSWINGWVNRREAGDLRRHGANLGVVVIDQSHRYGRHQAACREPAGSYDKTTRSAKCFEHKTQYLFIRATYTRIVVFWHISNIPPMISQSQISCNTQTFYIKSNVCEILLYNRQLVVITHELIYGVRAAIR